MTELLAKFSNSYTIVIRETLRGVHSIMVRSVLDTAAQKRKDIRYKRNIFRVFRRVGVTSSSSGSKAVSARTFHFGGNLLRQALGHVTWCVMRPGSNPEPADGTSCQASLAISSPVNELREGTRVDWPQRHPKVLQNTSQTLGAVITACFRTRRRQLPPIDTDCIGLTFYKCLSG